jgi:hypothetical protein
VLFVLVIGFRVWLILGIPKQNIAAPADDLYYAKTAHYLIHGDWLGPYGIYTIVKAPFYTFFIMGSFLLSMPLLVSETFFYLLSCLVLMISLKPLIHNRWWGLMLFTVMLYLPMSLATPWTVRVYREFVYFSLSLFVLAFTAGLFLRIAEKPSSLLGWATGLGGSMGAFMLCREEGVWIYPVLLLLLGICIWYIWKRRLSHKKLRTCIVLLPILLWYMPILIVSNINYSHYGFWGISEQLDRDFNRILNTLYRIKTDNWKPFNPVSRETLDKAYSVSPHLAELSPAIDRYYPIVLSHSDEMMQIKPDWYTRNHFETGNEMSGIYFFWLFRTALNSEGLFSSGHFPREHMQKIAEQLEAGCNNEGLDCEKGTGIPLLGSIKKEQVLLSIRFLGDYFYRTFAFDMIGAKISPLNISKWESYREEHQYFDELVYNPVGSGLFGPSADHAKRVGKKIDLRIKMMNVKQSLMVGIRTAYLALTLPWAILILIGWAHWGLCRHKHQRGRFLIQETIMVLFVFGLWVTRLSAMALVDATSGVPAENYLTSSYIYLFVLLSLSTVFLIRAYCPGWPDYLGIDRRAAKG